MYYLNAIKNKDSSLCDNIKTEPMDSECKKKLVLELAMEQKNPELCNELEDASECRSNVMFELSVLDYNLSLCQEISDRGLRDSCLNVIVPRDVLFTKDKSLCVLLSNEKLKESCNSLVDIDIKDSTPPFIFIKYNSTFIVSQPHNKSESNQDLIQEPNMTTFGYWLSKLLENSNKQWIKKNIKKVS